MAILNEGETVKINILDAGLSFKAGHHFDYGFKLVRFLAQSGHNVHVYGFSGMADDVADEFRVFATVTKLFRTYQYRTRAYDRYASDLVEYHEVGAEVADDLRSVRQADLWIWPTIGPHHLQACAAVEVDAPMVACVHWDPGIQAQSLEAMLWRDAIVAAHRRKLNYRLASVEGELRHRFAAILPAPGSFLVLPHPVNATPVREPKSALRRIGFFGHQRDEKGSKLMVPLLQQLAADGYAVTFQNSNRDLPLPKLSKVDVLGYVDDLAGPIADCDLIVLPYDVERYRVRGSGILAQCLALGVPASGPVGTMPGRTIEQLGIGPTFGATNNTLIYRAIKEAGAGYSVFATNAFKVARRFAQNNGVAQFASAFLAAAAAR